MNVDLGTLDTFMKVDPEESANIHAAMLMIHSAKLLFTEYSRISIQHQYCRGKKLQTPNLLQLGSITVSCKVFGYQNAVCTFHETH